MIIDNVKNSALYTGLGTGIRTALEYLAKTDFSAMRPGRYNIEGDNVYALVQQYETKPRLTGVWEAHRRYIDVQYVMAGIETMGYAPLDNLTVTQSYSAEKDCMLLAGKGSFVTAGAGTFVIFFPLDAHMPGLADTAPVSVLKVVVKVAGDQG